MTSDGIEIVASDPDWPAQFEEERTRLIQALAGERWLAIEHFGSTAVPGLDAKPIIDILVAVPSVDAARRSFPARLQSLDYLFWSDNPKQDRLFLVKGMPPHGTRRTHHVHVCKRPSEMWDRLLFRDWLRGHGEDARRYEALKHDAATRHPDDRDAYTDAKQGFVEDIMTRARMH